MVEEADTRGPSRQYHEEQSRETLRRVNQELEERVRERTALYELANAALHESEERLRAVIGSAPVVLFALDGEGVFTVAEGKGLDDLGIAQDELVGRPVFDMFSSQPEVHESVRKALAGEPATTNVGINTVFEAQLSPVRDEDGNVTGVIGVATDITERKQAEEALRESEEVLTAIVESTADGILVVNSSGQVIFANELFAKMWRIPDELLETRDREKLLAHVADQLEDPEGFLAKVRELYQTSQEDSDVLLFRDGRVFERFSRPFLTGNDAAGRVWSFRDITEQRRVVEALRDAANHDPLTGLLNRRAGNAAIEERLAEAQSNEKSFAMMVLDLDKFKSINDSFGHETGDAALVQFADVLSELVGKSGVVCRIGGDEFGVGMEDVDEDQAFALARRLQDTLRHALASSDMELRPQFTVSIGIACHPDDGDNVPVLSRRADRAMYEAKVAGCDTSRAWRQIDSSQAA